MNNFVSFRPQVLRKKVSVTRDSDRDFSTFPVVFRTHTWQASWQSNSDKGGPSIEIVIRVSKDSSPNLFLRVVFVKFWSLKLHSTSVVCKKIKCTYPWVYFFGRRTWSGNVNFMRHFFPNCGNPTRSRSRINAEVGRRQSHILSDVFATVGVFGS